MMTLDDYMYIDKSQLVHKIEFLNNRLKENKKTSNRMFKVFKSTGNLKCINVMNNLSYSNLKIEEEIKHLQKLVNICSDYYFP